jgi:hypothetical protein
VKTVHYYYQTIAIARQDGESLHFNLGCDRPPDEDPVLLIRGEDHDGATLFEHVAPALDAVQLHTAVLALEAQLGVITNLLTLECIQGVIDVMQRALDLATERNRRRHLVELLLPGESVEFADEVQVTRLLGGMLDVEGATLPFDPALAVAVSFGRKVPLRA